MFLGGLKAFVGSKSDSSRLLVHLSGLKASKVPKTSMLPKFSHVFVGQKSEILKFSRAF